MSEMIPVIKLFGPVIHGEGALSGQLSYFVLTGGCNFRCTWCDVPYAVYPTMIKNRASYMTEKAIAERVIALYDSGDAYRRLMLPWVTLTGGDPVMWDFTSCIMHLRMNKFRVAVETQGSLWHDWLEIADLVTCSPKPPSSGMLYKFDPAMLQKYTARLGKQLVFKIVVFDDDDLRFVARIHRFLPEVKMYVSVGTPVGVVGNDKLLANYRTVTERVLQMRELHDVTVLPRMHVLAHASD